MKKRTKKKSAMDELSDALNELREKTKNAKKLTDLDLSLFDDEEYAEDDAGFENFADFFDDFVTTVTAFTPRASGTWQDGHELFSIDQFASFELTQLSAPTVSREHLDAANLLGVDLLAPQAEIKSRIRRLSIRFPPELNPKRHEEHLAAAQKLQHPLNTASDALRIWVARDASELGESSSSKAPSAAGSFSAIIEWLNEK